MDTDASVFNRILQPTTNSSVSPEEFQSATKFCGPKDGFVFGTGVHGTGYYRDALQSTSSDKKRQLEVDANEAALKRQRVQEIVDSAESNEVVDAMDITAVRAAVLSLERRINTNLQQRTKFADNPPAFMESEMELDEHVKELYNLATTPEQYMELVRLGLVESVLGLIAHENTDISVNAIGLLSELTDPDVLGSDSDPGYVKRRNGMDALADSVLKQNTAALLVHNMGRLNDSDDVDAQGVHHSLNVIDNLLELRPDATKDLFENTKLLDMLLHQINLVAGGVQKDGFNPNRLYASEVLSTSVQSDPFVVDAFLKIPEPDGIDTLLHIIATFKKRDPDSIDEVEFLNNVGDVLCALLVENKARIHFGELEGTELMVRLLRGTIHVAPLGAKVLSFATTQSRLNCERFVEAGGLKFVSPLLMGRLKVLSQTKSSGFKPKVKSKLVKVELAKTMLALLSNLLSMLPVGEVAYRRVVKKFVENDCTKTERVVELHQQYEEMVENGVGNVDGEEEEDYLARLDSGLETVQHTCVILSHLLRASEACRELIKTKFYESNKSLSQVRACLLEFHYHVSDEEPQDESSATGIGLKSQLLELAKVVEYVNSQQST